jgi:putative tricarboxylic transport membrane protein
VQSRELRNPEGASALVCLVFAAAFGVEGFRLGLGTFGSPGPGLTPFLYACILAILSACLIVRSRVASRRFAVVLQWRSIVPILAILFAYALTIEWLGYVTCTFLALFALLRLAGARRVQSLVFAAVATGFVHLMFVRWLLVPLPVGSIFP